MDNQTQKNLLNIVKRNYEEIAEDFSETRKKHLWPELLKLTGSVKNGSKILDAGCGNGRLIEAFKGKDIDYLGVDASQKLLKSAKKQKPGFKFKLGDILKLGDIAEVNFDYVFCIAVLHHIPGKDLRVKALRQLKNKVSDEGKIIITAWNLWGQKKFRKLILKFTLLKLIKKNQMDIGDILFDWKNSAGEIVSRRYYHAFTKRQFKKIAKKAGLKIEKNYKDKYNYYIILKK
ncbi:class I SAM-dependent methyltransferase [Patescibacteria group bacterium]|nr:class I SAM-dependent methyltransferase [Candidatus Falkowbacteria bacterium]MBU3906067.1 class I SAM-dependent methyltransferase [Patescibacteria group bacterium]MBU4015155.1 class I SAM-dependent methyltransferase [Patescibacteria group bacterium]MBU4025933.1 class I SAM-dependent methyltransferase [Patescibacteria group bacterium]MBU4073115.1 class I SAM-dependent methyltransferase [Patescibacteria group bacterium]